MSDKYKMSSIFAVAHLIISKHNSVFINCLTSKRLCKQQANGNKGLPDMASKINENHCSKLPLIKTSLISSCVH